MSLLCFPNALNISIFLLHSYFLTWNMLVRPSMGCLLRLWHDAKWLLGDCCHQSCLKQCSSQCRRTEYPHGFQRGHHGLSQTEETQSEAERTWQCSYTCDYLSLGLRSTNNSFLVYTHHNQNQREKLLDSASP